MWLSKTTDLARVQRLALHDTMLGSSDQRCLSMVGRPAALSPLENRRRIPSLTRANSQF